jgi:PAT family beta-lactamase induction signal transducer AmpG
MSVPPQNEPDLTPSPAAGLAASATLVDSDGSDARQRSALGWVTTTYFAQGLPYAIVHQVSAQMFTELGVSLGGIGLSGLYGLAWNFKFAWSPLLDRFGTRRRWVVAAEVALACALAAVAWPAHRAQVALSAALIGVVAIASATHDIAIDGFYLGALDPGRQASHSGLRVAAYRAALLVGNGALVALAGKTSWPMAFLVASALMLALAVTHSRVLPAVASPVASSSKHSLWSAFPAFFRRPSAAIVVAFILLFRAGDAMMFAMAIPLLKSLGLDTSARGLMAGIGTAASVAGSMAAAPVISRVGLARALPRIALVQSVAILMYAWLAWARPSFAVIAVFVALEQAVAGIGTTAFVVFLARQCGGSHGASHFAIATALMTVAATTLGAPSGYIAGAVGFAPFFVLAFGASLPGLILSRKVPTQ